MANLNGVGENSKRVKFQNSSTKLQINLKFKYSMTKTFSQNGFHQLSNPGSAVIVILAELKADLLF